MPTGSGARLGPYVLGPALGAGGMGEVYRAHDSRLGRDVAIKLLPPDVADDPERLRRFESEARAAAALNHPNILVVHDVGREHDTSYLVTELLEGRTLRDVIDGGAVPLTRALDYAVQIAEGLAAAHARGIVHRDLKPENVFVTADGRVKILDFGLAKAVRLGEAAVASTLGHVTAPNVVLGTPGYMAPEQVRGEPVDQRADIFAFGCVLYELLGGRPAFAGATTLEILSAILRDTPAPPASLPPALARIVTRCLEKEPERRFQRAGEVHAALEAIQTGAGLSGAMRVPRHPLPHARLLVAAAVVLLVLAAGWWGATQRHPPPPRMDSIAVLPLANFTGDPGQQHFVDATHDGLIAELGQIGALTVISRQSVLRYRETEKAVPEIARELNVDALVEGSVFRAGDTVRITVQLLQARPTERQLWAGTFQRDLGGILGLQGQVARAIAEQVRVAVSPSELARLARNRPVDPAAYQAWLRGWVKFTERSADHCIMHAEESAAIDPDYAPAYVLAAQCYRQKAYFTQTRPHEAFPKIKVAAEHAIKLDPLLGVAYAPLGAYLAAYEWDWGGADRTFQRALELTPSEAETHQSYSTFLVATGRHDEAIEHARRAEQLSPGRPSFRQNLAFVLYLARRYDEAIAQAQRTIELAPNGPFGSFRLAQAYTEKGMYDEAVTALERGIKLAGDQDVRWKGYLARTYGLAGHRNEALRILAELLALEQVSYVPPTAIAVVHLGLGQLDEAMNWFDKAYEIRDGDLYLIPNWPGSDPLRSDERFQRLLQRMNFPR
jgi:eukaryotic-like serine/threonine-protein kinase